MKSVVTFVAGAFVFTIASLGQEVDRSFLDEWKFVGARNPAVAINGVAKSDDGVFVAVGDEGVILRSENETSWLLQYPETDATLEQVVYSNGQFIVVASDPGQILTSSDGFGWEIQNFPEQRLKYIAVGFFGLLAVGEDGRHLFSPDGVVWENADSVVDETTKKRPLYCGYVNGVFQLIEFVEYSEPSSGSAIHASQFASDLKWSEAKVSLEELHSPGAREATSANLAKGIALLTFGTDGFLISSDFENWSAPDVIDDLLDEEVDTSGGVNYQSAFFNDGIHYLEIRTGFQEIWGVYYKSEDGVNWDRARLSQTPPAAYFSIDNVLYGSYHWGDTTRLHRIDDIGDPWTAQYALYQSDPIIALLDIGFDGKTLIAGERRASGGNGGIWASGNGLAWEFLSSPVIEGRWDLSEVETIGDRWVINATSSSLREVFFRSFVSEDGIEWDWSPDNTMKIVHGDGHYVGLRAYKARATMYPEIFRVFRSSDFENWEEVVLPVPSDLERNFDILFHNDRLWLTSFYRRSAPYDFYYSDDVGESWTFHASLSASESPLTLIGDRFVRIDESGFAHSEDGFTWNSISLSDTHGNEALPFQLPLVYENGLYFGIGAEGEIEVYGETGLLTRHSSGFDGLVFAYGRAIAFGSGNIAVSPIAPWAESTRLINLSSRSWAGTGADSMIAGIVALSSEGTLEQNNLVMRGIGPSLEDQGVGAFAPNPRIHYSYNTRFNNEVIAYNEDWGGGSELSDAFASVGAFALDSQSADAAILGSPVRDTITYVNVQDDEGGIALIEAYRLDGANYEFFNLSTRARASEGENSLMAGFVLDGETIRSLLIRAVGPSLAEHGLEDVMEDPVLTVYSGNKVIASNRGWDNSAIMKHFFERAGAGQLEEGADDAVLVVTLNPGLYTVHVSSESGQSGIVLLDLFDLGE